MTVEQVKKIEMQIKECDDELEVVAFERGVGMRVARVRKLVELEQREAEVRTKISQLGQLIEEIKKQEGDET